jgi:hypothetical protein
MRRHEGRNATLDGFERFEGIGMLLVMYQEAESR